MMKFRLNLQQSLITFLTCGTVLAIGPVNNAFAAPTPSGVATVFAAPSNVRVRPNGRILCTVISVREIAVWNSR